MGPVTPTRRANGGSLKGAHPGTPSRLGDVSSVASDSDDYDDDNETLSSAQRKVKGGVTAPSTPTPKRKVVNALDVPTPRTNKKRETLQSRLAAAGTAPINSPRRTTATASAAPATPRRSAAPTAVAKATITAPSTPGPSGEHKGDKVVVCTRIKPTNSPFLHTAYELTNTSLALSVQHPNVARRGGKAGREGEYTYTFDTLVQFPTKTPELYADKVAPLVDSAMKGFNSTVFAYGQTGSGKSHTMSGTADELGIIPCAVDGVFDAITGDTDRAFLLRVSYIEIYNETLRDLLNLKKGPLADNEKPVIHTRTGKVAVEPLVEEIVSTPQDVVELLTKGNVNRKTGATDWNERSSRSHAVFTITIESRPRDDDGGNEVRVSRLTLIDLAGSEKAVSDLARRGEGKHINQSLLALREVINKLTEKGKKTHIPYRNSKLTHLLENVLGGDSNICVICTMSGEEAHTSETLETLKFAGRCSQVETKAQKNILLSSDRAVIRAKDLEIAELKRQLEELAGGGGTQAAAGGLALSNEMAELADSVAAMEARKSKLSEQLAKLNGEILTSELPRSGVGLPITSPRKKRPRISDFTSLSSAALGLGGLGLGTPVKSSDRRAVSHMVRVHEDDYASVHDAMPDNPSKRFEEDVAVTALRRIIANKEEEIAAQAQRVANIIGDAEELPGVKSELKHIRNEYDHAAKVHESKLGDMRQLMESTRQDYVGRLDEQTNTIDRLEGKVIDLNNAYDDMVISNKERMDKAKAEIEKVSKDRDLRLAHADDQFRTAEATHHSETVRLEKESKERLEKSKQESHERLVQTKKEMNERVERAKQDGKERFENAKVEWMRIEKGHLATIESTTHELNTVKEESHAKLTNLREKHSTEIAKIKDMVRALREKSDESAARVVALEAERTELKATVVKIEQDRNSLLTERDNLVSDCNTLRGERDGAWMDLASSKDHASKLAEQLEATQGERDAARAAARADVAKAQVETQRQAEQLEGFQRQALQREGEVVNKLRNDLIKERERRVEVEGHLEKHRKMLEAARAETAKEREVRENIKAELKEWRTKNKVAEEANVKLQASLKEAKTSHDVLNEQHRALQKEKDTIVKTANKRESELADSVNKVVAERDIHRDHSAQLKGQLGTVQSQLTEREAMHAASLREIDALSAGADIAASMKRELHNLRGALDKERKERTTLADAHTGAATRGDSLATQLDEAREALDKEKTARVGLTSTLERTQGDLNKEKKSHVKTKADIETLKNQLETSKGHTAEFKRQLAAEQKIRATHDSKAKEDTQSLSEAHKAERATLNGQVATLNGQVASLHGEIEVHKNERADLERRMNLLRTSSTSSADKVRNDLDQIRAELSQWKSAHAEADRKLETETRAREEHERAAKAARAQLAEEAVLREVAAKQAQEATEAHNNVSKDLAAATRELDALSRELADVMSRSATPAEDPQLIMLQKELDLARSEHDAMRARSDRLTAELSNKDVGKQTSAEIEQLDKVIDSQRAIIAEQRAKIQFWSDELAKQREIVRILTSDAGDMSTVAPHLGATAPRGTHSRAQSISAVAPRSTPPQSPSGSTTSSRSRYTATSRSNLAVPPGGAPSPLPMHEGMKFNPLRKARRITIEHDIDRLETHEKGRVNRIKDTFESPDKVPERPEKVEPLASRRRL